MLFSFLSCFGNDNASDRTVKHKKTGRSLLLRSLPVCMVFPCLEVSTMFLLKRLYQNIQMCAYLSHFSYAKNYFNFFVFMI